MTPSKSDDTANIYGELRQRLVDRISDLDVSHGHHGDPPLWGAG